MIRRLLSVILVIASTAALAPKAFAQTADIPFTGTVSGSCTFGQVTPGTLGVNQPTNPTEFGAGFAGGVMGKVSVSCNAPANLMVSAPVQTGGPAFNPTASEGFVKSPNGSTISTNGSPLALSPGNSIPLDVDAHIVKGSPLVPGTYNYKVTLTITP